MPNTLHRFGDFELDPASRELRLHGELVSLPPKSFECLVYLIEHRDRAVGRDELISAVWGRVDASDAVVSQTLLRARRAIGETGSEQASVRTVPRFGYRWIAPVETVVAQPDEATIAEPSEASVGPVPAATATEVAIPPRDAATPGPATAAPLHRRWWAWSIAGLVALAIIVAFWHERSQPTQVPASDLVVVLPVSIAPGNNEHAWIRLGAMDYLASRLRRNGNLTVLPSEQVLRLTSGETANIEPSDAVDRLRATTGARWIIRPAVERTASGWRFRLHLNDTTESYEVDAQGATPLDAAAAAADTLLRRLGREGASISPAPTALTERLQQVDAELLAGQLAAARGLIHSAPSRQREDPQLQVREGQLEFRAGRLDAAASLFSGLLEDAATLPTEVRAKAMMGLGAVALRRGDAAEAEQRYGRAVQMLEADPATRVEPAWLGNAYNGRGAARVELGRLNEGLADFGRARIAMQRAGDEVEAASVGNNIGMLEARHGGDAQAVREFNLAIATFERFDVRDNLVVALLSRANSRLQLLQPAEALADSTRAMELGRELENPQLLGFMLSVHASALLANGELDETERLLREMPLAPAALRLRLLLERGRFSEARQLVDSALREPGAPINTLLLPAVQAAIADGDITQARQWLSLLPEDEAASGDPSVSVSVSLARALVAAASGDEAAATQAFNAARDRAAVQQSPAEAMRVAAATVLHLIAMGELDRASEVMGGLSTHAEHDYRAARAALALYRALDERALQAQTETRVRALAGERDPDLPVVY